MKKQKEKYVNKLKLHVKMPSKLDAILLGGCFRRNPPLSFDFYWTSWLLCCLSWMPRVAACS